MRLPKSINIISLNLYWCCIEFAYVFGVTLALVGLSCYDASTPLGGDIVTLEFIPTSYF